MCRAVYHPVISCLWCDQWLYWVSQLTFFLILVRRITLFFKFCPNRTWLDLLFLLKLVWAVCETVLRFVSRSFVRFQPVMNRMVPGDDPHLIHRDQRVRVRGMGMGRVRFIYRNGVFTHAITAIVIAWKIAILLYWRIGIVQNGFCELSYSLQAGPRIQWKRVMPRLYESWNNSCAKSHTAFLFHFYAVNMVQQGCGLHGRIDPEGHRCSIQISSWSPRLNNRALVPEHSSAFQTKHQFSVFPKCFQWIHWI